MSEPESDIPRSPLLRPVFNAISTRLSLDAIRKPLLSRQRPTSGVHAISKPFADLGDSFLPSADYSIVFRKCGPGVPFSPELPALPKPRRFPSPVSCNYSNAQPLGRENS
jgi:hypothetical protein